MTRTDTLKTLPAVESQRRVEFACNCIARFVHTSEMVVAICDQYHVQWRQAKRILKAAREYLLELSRRPKEEWIAEQIDCYKSIACDVTAKRSDRIAALTRIDKLLGLQQASQVKVEFQDTTEQRLDQTLSSAKEDELQALVDLLQERAKCQPTPN